MLKALWRVVIILARWIGRIQAWMLFTLVYLLLVAPLAVIFKIVADPLRLRKNSGPIWQTRSQPQPADRWRWAKAQF